MLGEALSMLDRAQRLQRQFFTHDVVSWEPPVDIVEADNALLVHVALPGVSADAITIALDPAGITISALRAFPCRTERSEEHTSELQSQSNLVCRLLLEKKKKKKIKKLLKSKK